MFPRWSDWDIEYTRKGLIKKRIRHGLKYVAFAAIIVGLYQARRSGENFGTLYDALWRRSRSLVVGLLTVLQHGVGKVVATI